MRWVGAIVRFVVVASTALACGSGSTGTATDLPITFPDSRIEDPGAATDPGRSDTSTRDPGQGTDAAPDADRQDESPRDPGPEDEGIEDPGLPDPGAVDPGKDPGTDPGATDPGPADPGSDVPGCGTGPACAAGTTCIDATCETCRFQFACGPDCRNCVGTATPLCLDGACVRCRVGSDCGAGFWCRPDTHACEPCGDTDPTHCGATCSVCPTDLPECVGGACTCNATSCGALYCIEGACSGCDADGACGPTCAACPVETPRCLSGTCVTCRDPGDCAAGSWCDAGTCAACGPFDPAHCGTDCAACGGETPTCAVGACTCDAASCGVGRRCVDGACLACDVDGACGPSCGACGDPKPFCISGACRQCRTAGDCPANWACGADGACIDPCAGTLGCATDSTPNAKTCATARTIGRTPAAVGLVISGDTTGQGDDDNLPSNATPNCFDAQVDQMYRVYLRAGDTLNVTATPLPSTYTMSLKLYRGTACAGNWKSDLITCQWGGDGDAKSAAYTAVAAGWVTIVVDGASAFDTEEDWGLYQLATKLTCADASCCCR